MVYYMYQMKGAVFMSMLDLLVDEIKNLLSNPIQTENISNDDEFDFSDCMSNDTDNSWFSEFE